MKRFCIWMFLLNKRLLRKKEFVILLCLIPLLVLGMRMISRQDSGVITIAISNQEESDQETMQVIQKLMQEDSIIRYVFAKEEQARELVATGEVDCAWIFRENFREKLVSTFSYTGQKTPPIYVVAKEDNVALQLARTNLYGSVYPQLAMLLCETYLQGEYFDEEQIDTQKLMNYYQQASEWNDLFQMVYMEPEQIPDMQGVEIAESKESYLMMPIRGMLVIFVMVCGLVVTLYYLQDMERGMFAPIPVRRRGGLLYSYVIAATFDAGVVVFLSLFVSDGRVPSLREVVLLVLFGPLTALFCNLVRMLCRSKENLARWIPLLVIAMLALCPVFLDLGKLFALQYIFPPTYYLRALSHDKMLFPMLGYALLLWGMGTLLQKVAQKKEFR